SNSPLSSALRSTSCAMSGATLVISATPYTVRGPRPLPGDAGPGHAEPTPGHGQPWHHRRDAQPDRRRHPQQATGAPPLPVDQPATAPERLPQDATPRGPGRATRWPYTCIGIAGYRLSNAVNRGTSLLSQLLWTAGDIRGGVWQPGGVTESGNSQAGCDF